MSVGRAQAVVLCTATLALAVACAGSGEGAPIDSGAAGGITPTLSAVRARGVVRCGISQAAGFATPDDDGRWQGFDIDFCRAIAVALFNDAEKAEFIPYTQQQRFAGLQSREVDILINGTSKTMTRATRQPFHFGPVYFYDGQGFMVPKTLGVTKATQLNDATVCVQQGTTTELNLTDFARRNAIRFRPVVIEDHRSAVDALAGGRCDVMTQDGAGLATTRTMLQRPDAFVILPERISKEPIASVVRYGDDAWLELISWVFHATVQAEELGIGRETAAEVEQSNDPGIRRFLGLEPGVTDALGLDAQWPLRVIRAVGNYGEIFERHLGPRTPLGMERGLNRLWNDGGLMYAPPFR